LIKNKIAAIIAGIISIMLASTTLTASATGKEPVETSHQIMNLLERLSVEPELTLMQEHHLEFLAQLREQEENQEILDNNTEKMNKAIEELKKYVNVTWYVFAGSSPRGWDCSGLVKWTYKKMGVDLYHRAGAQKNSGRFVKEKDAKVGDLVSFGYKGYRGAWHIGIYIGDGKMIHSPRRGLRTRIQSVDSFGARYNEVKYTRIIETN
jgi:cell wall-associated NlpC family hydrolase